DFLNPLNPRNPAKGRPTRAESLLMLEAHGLSVVEIKRNQDGAVSYVKGSPYNRRITGSTLMVISGPAKGHRLMRTSYDPKGTFVYGTLNNCAAGKTPWGTVLTCEENFHSYFGGNIINIKNPFVQQIHQRYGVPGSFSRFYGFHNYMDRFHIEREPNEAFRFGWVVEVDPYDPSRVPVKRTALGRFKHEAATCAIGKSGKVAVYMGDDERFEYVYKFVTKNAFNPNNREANFSLLDEGTLYVAKFNDDFTGEWIMLTRVDGSRIEVNPNLPEVFKNDPVLVFINTRGAGDAVGATRMDRPEDIEWNPVTKSVWVALTYNERRGTTGNPSTDKANPRATNYYGHIIEIKEEGDNPEATRFSWKIAMLCGIPGEQDPSKRLEIYGQPAPSNAPAISAPDNLVFDRLGNVWIATDGNPSSVRLSKNDGVYVLNPFNRDFKMFLSGVPGCEICGPEFSDDYKYFFCAIQHPGEDPQDQGRVMSRWPYLNDGVQVPRPSVIAVRRKDGRDIYA
ncbi:MAG: PhoX family phosphatase, partial [Aquificota bacterium]